MSNVFFFSKVLKYHLPSSNAHAQKYDVRVTNVWVHRLRLDLQAARIENFPWQQINFRSTLRYGLKSR